MLLISEHPLTFSTLVEKLQLRHSNKNIPIPSQQSYKLQLMGKINLAIKQMGWKAFFYEQRR